MDVPLDFFRKMLYLIENQWFERCAILCIQISITLQGGTLEQIKY